MCIRDRYQRRVHGDNFDEHKKKPPYLNSPRSIDACRRQGIDPSELLYLNLDEFKDSMNEINVDKDLLKLCWQHHEEKRKEKLKVVVEERLHVIEEEKNGIWVPMKSVQMASGMKSKSFMNSSSTHGKSAVVVTDSAMLDRERKQLEKIKLKQQQELQQMMEYEMKMQQIKQTNEEKMAKEREREEIRQRDLVQRQKEQEKIKHQKELEKQQRIEEEALREKQRQIELNEKQKEKEEREKIKEKQRQKEIKQREEEQRLKQEEFKKQTEEKLRVPVSYTHLRAHETSLHLVCRLLLEKKKNNIQTSKSTRHDILKTKLETHQKSDHE
eukprot:TRINITY_DN17430_c0_g1_i1.p1 TRINITY_DN17430_c0_g1~~TRINITY_DN17430_c0_g1_i1.p1  ORF type:complete len:327 (-),score=97.69 TRINITY_DN17430_c0_g1_i1:8-988(-)